MENLAVKMKARLETATRVNNQLASEISSNGGGASGMKAQMFFNASKDLVSINTKIRNLLASGQITAIEYKYIIN